MCCVNSVTQHPNHAPCRRCSKRRWLLAGGRGSRRFLQFHICRRPRRLLCTFTRCGSTPCLGTSRSVPSAVHLSQRSYCGDHRRQKPLVDAISQCRFEPPLNRGEQLGKCGIYVLRGRAGLFETAMGSFGRSQTARTGPPRVFFALWAGRYRGAGAPAFHPTNIGSQGERSRPGSHSPSGALVYLPFFVHLPDC